MVTSPAAPTPKGERTRARILDAASQLIHEHGVAGTSNDGVKAAAGVSGSQLYHYFADKDSLVQAVIDRQADEIVSNQRHADFATIEGLQAWRDTVVAAARHSHGKGGCPLGSLGSQLAESDEEARVRVATGFARWATALADGVRTWHQTGLLAPGIDPDDLAVTLLATLQGGLLLAQVRRDIRPLETALDTVMELATRGSA